MISLIVIANHTNSIPNNTNIISLPAGRQVVIRDSIRKIRDRYYSYD